MLCVLCLQFMFDVLCSCFVSYGYPLCLCPMIHVHASDPMLMIHVLCSMLTIHVSCSSFVSYAYDLWTYPMLMIYDHVLCL
jgi:hypothetical protein